jgi:hypothetical protein
LLKFSQKKTHTILNVKNLVNSIKVA